MKNLSISQIVKQASKDTNLLIKKTSDFDGDGVPNYKDCQPLNPKKHGVEPNILMRRRIEKLPIYVTDGIVSSLRGGPISRSYHIGSVEARRYAPVARKMILSILKMYPELITQIERKRPKVVCVTSKPDPEGKLQGFASPIGRGDGVVVIYAIPEELRTKIRGEFKEFDIKRGDIASSGGSIRHELEHIKQIREGSEGGVLRPKVSRRITRGEYEERPQEKQAFRAEKRLVRKHFSEKFREKPEGGIAGFFRRLF